MEIIDTHQHLWELGRLSYSWVERVPALNRTFSSTDYELASGGTGIVATIFVEADVDWPDILAETQFALEMADLGPAHTPPILGVVAAVRPESPGYREHLNSIAEHPRLKGVRRILHTEPDELSTEPLFRSNVAYLADYGLSFDICVLAHQLPRAIDLVDSCPKVEFILDHLGNPPVRGDNPDQWSVDLKELSLRPNVSCKISGIVTQADHKQWTPDDLTSFVDHAIECFGWDRVIFGSDWPVCTRASTLERWVTTLTDLTAKYGEENQRKLFHDNALRIYRC